MKNTLSWLPLIIVIINLIITITVKFNDLSHIQKVVDKIEVRQMDVLQRLSNVEGRLKIRGGN